MEVDESIALTAEYKGKLYFFCSEGCRERFFKGHPSSGRRSTYELIIIGGGPAGLTAAVYAATMKIDTFVITKNLGGQAYDSTKIQNYMGYDFITGPELVAKFRDQLIHPHYVDHLMSEVEKIEIKNN
jgi:alkyl hydroperoxide reductase subunit F